MKSAASSAEVAQHTALQVLTDDPLAQDATSTISQLCDLRRSHHRDVVDRIVERAQALPPRERAMVEGVYLRRASAVEIGKELDIPPRIVRRDVRATVRRLMAPVFGYVLVHRDRWSGHRRQVAQLCFIEGISLRAAASMIGLSFHKVRRHDEAIRLMFEAFEAQRRRAS